MFPLACGLRCCCALWAWVLSVFIFPVQVEFWVSWPAAVVFQLSVRTRRICTRDALGVAKKSPKQVNKAEWAAAFSSMNKDKSCGWPPASLPLTFAISKGQSNEQPHLLLLSLQLAWIIKVSLANWAGCSLLLCHECLCVEAELASQLYI